MSHTSAMVIPRWEWRTFAPSLAALRRRVDGVAFDAPRESQETYLLCLRSSHNAKVRDGIMDLKWRKQVDPEGLELWDPVLKAAFPLDATLLPRLFEAWGLPIPALKRASYTLDQFLDEIMRPNPALRAVRTVKRREGFILDGTQCEFARIVADGVPLESFCVEHEDPSLVFHVIRSLALDSHQNINYPLGLKRALSLLNGLTGPGETEWPKRSNASFS
jgi:exopolyphosphatase / guanosine-5'-triphosphate,3'-diphosphate pyrophosphatase